MDAVCSYLGAECRRLWLSAMYSGIPDLLVFLALTLYGMRSSGGNARVRLEPKCQLPDCRLPHLHNGLCRRCVNPSKCTCVA